MIILCLIMSYRLSDPVERQCSECKATFETRTANTTTCGPECARARKTRLQKSRRVGQATKPRLVKFRAAYTGS
jgi:predicted RNA-binding Zn-ribbon protein involved in translation (DUF1610 family)